MTKTFICENPECVQEGIEFTLTDPQPITTCGGCQQALEGIEA